MATEGENGTATLIIIAVVLVAGYLLWQQHLKNIAAASAQPNLVVQGAKAVGGAVVTGVKAIGHGISSAVGYVTGAPARAEAAVASIPVVGGVAKFGVTGAIDTGIKLPLDTVTGNFGGALHDIEPWNW